MPKVFSEVVEKATVPFLLWKVPWLAAAPLWKLRAPGPGSRVPSGRVAPHMQRSQESLTLPSTS